MKKINLSIIFALALILSISSCKKKDDDPKPATPVSFSFPTTTDLVVEMSWTVNGLAAGNSYADLDFDIYNWNAGTTTYTNIESSGSGSTFESTTLSKTASDYTSTFGIIYWANETGMSSLTAPYTIAYTIKVYPVGNSAAAKTYTSTIAYEASPNNDLAHNVLSIVKSGSTFSFVELSPKTTFDYNTIP